MAVTLELFPHRDGDILAFKKEDGTIVERKTESGEPYIMPKWCGMPPSEHASAWGCMGIGYDLVGKEGEKYCLECECHKGEQ